MESKKYIGKGISEHQKKVTMLGRNIPNIVLLILMVIFNSASGIIDTEMDKGLAKLVSNPESFDSTYIKVGMIYAVLIIVGWINDRICKLGNRKLLDESFTKSITKLTNSSILSVTKLTTGGADNIILSIARADKELRTRLVDIVPTLVPFFTICVIEYKTAGFIPVLLNVLSVASVVGLYMLQSHMKFMDDSYTAGNKMRSITKDCISNSLTVKFFHKEKWSINRQVETQKEVFADIVCPKKTNWHIPIRICGYLPTFINIYLCRHSIATVSIILVMGNAVWNAINQIDALMESYAEKKIQTNKLESVLEEDIIASDILHNGLKIDHAVVSYNKERKFYLDGINIPKGARCALVGKSGTGKSTIAKAICGMYAVDEGYVPYYSNLYMFAEGEMFNTSIYENISFGDKSITREEVKSVLDNLDLEIDFDLDESVGENGNKLSTGMKQRVNLARVIVYIRRHQDDLIVLDECTSALDPETSIKVIEFLKDELDKSRCTLIYISNKTDYIDSGLTTSTITAYKDKDGNTRIR